MCLELGVPHPDHLGEILTSRQIAEWHAYARYVGALPGRMSEYMHAQTARTVAESNRNPKGRRRAFRVDEFLPKRRQIKTRAQIIDALERTFKRA